MQRPGNQHNSWVLFGAADRNALDTLIKLYLVPGSTPRPLAQLSDQLLLAVMNRLAEGISRIGARQSDFIARINQIAMVFRERYQGQSVENWPPELTEIFDRLLSASRRPTLHDAFPAWASFFNLAFGRAAA